MRVDKFVEKLKFFSKGNLGDAKVVKVDFDKDIIIRYVSKVNATFDNGTGLSLCFEYGNDESKGLSVNQLIKAFKEFNHEQYFPYTPVLMNAYGAKVREIKSAIMYKTDNTFVVIS